MLVSFKASTLTGATKTLERDLLGKRGTVTGMKPQSNADLLIILDHNNSPIQITEQIY